MIGKLIGKLNYIVGFYCPQCGKRFGSPCGVGVHRDLHVRELRRKRGKK